MTGPASGCDLSDVGLFTTGQTETIDNFPLAELWVVLDCYYVMFFAMSRMYTQTDVQRPAPFPG